MHGHRRPPLSRGAPGLDPDRLGEWVGGSLHRNGRHTIQPRAGKPHLGLGPPFHRQRKGAGCDGTIRDAQQVVEICPPLPGGVTHLHQHLGRLAERVDQPGVPLQARSIVAVPLAQFAPVGVEQGDLRIHRAPQSPADHFKYQGLRRRHLQPEPVCLFRIDFPLHQHGCRDRLRRRPFLGRRRRLHHRQVVQPEHPVRPHPVAGGHPHQLQTSRGVRACLNFHGRFGGVGLGPSVHPVHLAGNTQPQTGGLVELTARQGHFNGLVPVERQGIQRVDRWLQRILPGRAPCPTHGYQRQRGHRRPVQPPAQQATQSENRAVCHGFDSISVGRIGGVGVWAGSVKPANQAGLGCFPRNFAGPMLPGQTGQSKQKGRYPSGEEGPVPASSLPNPDQPVWSGLFFSDILPVWNTKIPKPAGS